MTNVHAVAVTVDSRQKPDDGTTARCAACAHPGSAHDVIAARFCAATTAHALARGCACRQ